jgi:leucyl aminopeptidase
MKFLIKTDNLSDIKSDMLIKGYFKKNLNDSLKTIDELLKGKISKVVKLGDFSGKEKESFLLYSDGLIKTEKVLLFGLGELNKLSLNSFRKFGAWYAKQTLKMKITKITIDITEHKNLCTDLAVDEISAFSAFIEGIILSQYKYDKYKKKEEEFVEIKEIIFMLPKGTELQQYTEALNNTIVICEAVFNARDYANSPGCELNPVTFSNQLKTFSKKLDIKTTILKKKEIEAKKMGGLLAVGQGSKIPPRFVIMEYNIDKVEYDTIVLVGKGVTFDSGGISLKPSQNMAEMKMDMSGAAAVAGAIEAISKLKLPLRVIGLLPLAENMPGGAAQRPGDIITISNGKTVEVDNTDAEGRLILADALAYAVKYKPKLIIDLATLTGACVVALGQLASGMMGTDKININKLKESGERTYERVWELPLFDEYDELIKSDVADVKNVGGRWGGAITAAMFLKKFVDDFPWIHIDIAGPAILEKETDYEPKGGSGYGVRLLVDFLKNWNN